MGIFRDDLGIRPWAVGVAATLLIAGISAGAITWVFKAELAAGRETCDRVAQTTQRQTQFVDNGWRGECYVYVNEQWIPLNNWRVN